MSATDLELLGIFKNGPGSAVAVALAARVLYDAGKPVSITAICDLTGYSRTGLYKGRKWLDRHLPTWRPWYEVTRGPGDGTKHRPVGPIVKVVELPPPAPEPLPERPVVSPNGDAPLIPLWKTELETHVRNIVGKRSWDAYRDIYSPTADALLAMPELETLDGEMIALTVDYVRFVGGSELTSEERKLVALLVRTYGKVALYGFKEGMGVADPSDVKAVWRYARRVCEHTVADIRRGGAQP